MAAAGSANALRRLKPVVPGALAARHRGLRVWRFPCPKHDRAGVGSRQRRI